MVGWLEFKLIFNHVEQSQLYIYIYNKETSIISPLKKQTSISKIRLGGDFLQTLHNDFLLAPAIPTDPGNPYGSWLTF